MARPRAGYSVAVVAAAVVVTAAVGTGLVLAFRDRLPDPVATHWGASGVDGFLPLSTALWAAGGVLVFLGVLFGYSVNKAYGSRRSMVTGLAVGTITGLSTLIYALTLSQVDLADARDVGGPGPAIGIALVVGLVFGATVARTLKRLV